MSEYKLRPVITYNRIQSKIREIAKTISAQYKDKNLVMVGILKGAFIFLADLVRELSIPVEIDFIRLASYGTKAESSGSVQLTKDIELPLEGKDVVIVEDIVDTGYTLEFLVDHLKKKNPRSVKVCALVDKSERRTCPVKIDFTGFKIPRGFLVGYGLDFSEKFRYLKDVYEIIFEKESNKK